MVCLAASIPSFCLLDLYFILMNNSFIKLYRGLLDWEWYSDVNTKTVFIHCLIKANWEDKKWRGLLIKRGQFYTSIGNLSNELNLSNKQIRLSLDKLKSTKELDIKGANKGTMITICKYDDYQSLDNQEGKQKANKGQLLRSIKKKKK